MAANLPHMEATAFPMCFPLLMMIILSMLFHLSSLPILFCPSRAENELIDTRGGTRPSSFYPSLFLSFNILRLAVFDLFFLTVCATPIQSASYSDPQIKSLMTSAKISHKIQAKFHPKAAFWFGHQHTFELHFISKQLKPGSSHDRLALPPKDTVSPSTHSRPAPL